MKYPRIISAAAATPWAIEPGKLRQIRDFLKLKGGGGRVPAPTVAAIAAGKRSGAAAIAEGGVALYPIMGIICPRMGLLEEISGGVSCEEIGADLDLMLADKSIRSIVFVFDTPGGAVTGVPELGEKIYIARETKPIHAYVDPLSASAGYWLASQCSQIVCTPSGEVGSIGVVSFHEDHSREEAKQGLKTTLVTSSRFKGELSPYAPLSDEARAALQSHIDEYYAQFLAAVAHGRGTTIAKVEKGYGQGRTLLAAEALQNGMIDRIGELGELIGSLASSNKPSGFARADATAAPLTTQRARCRLVEIGGPLS